MTLRLSASAVCIAIVAFALMGCGGGGSNGHATVVPLPTNEQGTPLSFEAARDAFAERLDAIGVNICCVPPDVRQNLIDQCEELALYAQQDAVDQICTAVGRAMDRGDPGLIDLILPDLRALQAK
jgi:hypothetical protein